MVQIYRAALAFVAVVFMAACSSVKLAYNQLDWVVPLYLEGYVGLDRGQSQALKGHVGELLQWHCGTQLAGYAHDVRDIHANFENGTVSATRLDAHYGRILAHWQAIRAQAAPRVAALLAGATDEQIEELFARLEKENRKLKAEHVDRSEAERRNDARKALGERLEYWIGDLTTAQREALADWSRAFALNGTERLAFRQRWQGELRRVLERRAAPERFAADVQALITHPERYWSEAYRDTNGRNRRELLALLARLGSTLTPVQRAQLTRRAEAWAEAFEQLACAPAPIQSASAASAPAGAP